MEEISANYSVVIRSGLPLEETKLLEQFCGKITGENGEFLYQFFCKSINTQHHYYIEMVAFNPGEEGDYCMRIPHSLVFLITGSEKNKSIGFAKL